MTAAIQQFADLVAVDIESAPLLDVLGEWLNAAPAPAASRAVACALRPHGAQPLRVFHGADPHDLDRQVRTWARKRTLGSGQSIIVAQPIAGPPFMLSVRVEPYGDPVRAWEAPIVGLALGDFERVEWSQPAMCEVAA